MRISDLPEPTFFVFSSLSIIPKMLYYSHIPPMVLAFLMGLFVYFKTKKSLVGKTFLGLNVSFSLWLIIDLISWTNPYTDVQVYVWSLFGLFSYLITFFSLYFYITFLKKNFWEYKGMIIFLIFIFVEIYYSISSQGIAAFDISIAGAYEKTEYLFVNSLINLLGTLYLFWISILSPITSEDPELKQKKIMAIGLLSLLVPFHLFSIIGSYLIYSGKTLDYGIESYGTFSIVIFLAIITYLIVKYRIFGIYWHETKVLVVTILILIASQVFFLSDKSDRWLAIGSFILTFILSFMIIRIIKIEEQQKYIELEKINQELRKLDQAKTEFMNIASHQLRSPLTLIKGVSSLLLSGKINKFSSQDRDNFYQSMWRKCLKLENIINDILHAAAFSNEKFCIQINRSREVNLSRLINKIIEDYKYEINKKGISLNLIAPKNHIICVGEEGFLEEAFVNILTNAIKYTPAKKNINNKKVEKGEIKIEIVEKNKIVKIIFEDNGIGIPKDEIQNVFTRFYRSSSSKRVTSEGIGLGLYIVKEIVDGHGGKIEVESEEGIGTRFIIKFFNTTR